LRCRIRHASCVFALAPVSRITRRNSLRPAGIGAADLTQNA